MLKCTVLHLSRLLVEHQRSLVDLGHVSFESVRVLKTHSRLAISAAKLVVLLWLFELFFLLILRNNTF